MKITAVSGGFYCDQHPNELVKSLLEERPETAELRKKLEREYIDWPLIRKALALCKFYIVPMRMHSYGWRLYGFDREVGEEIGIIAGFIAEIMTHGEMIIWLTFSCEKLYGIGIRDKVVHEIKPDYVWIPDQPNRGLHFTVNLHVADILREAFEEIKGKIEKLNSDELLQEIDKRALLSNPFSYLDFAKVLVSEWAIEWIMRGGKDELH